MDTYLDDDNDGLKGLRKQYKKLGDENKELRSMVDQLMADRNSSGVADILASSGLDPRVAKFYPKDSPTDSASVAQWVDENKDIFGNRRIVDQGTLNSDTFTETERRGYQIIQDMAAYQDGVNLDLKSQLDTIQYDPMNPEKAQNELLAKLKEFEGLLHM